MNKTVIFFTDKHSRIITDSYNLDMAILNSFRDIWEFDNTAIIMDRSITNIISNDYIFGDDRLGIYVSDDYGDNYDFCVNIKDELQMNKFISDHPNIPYLYVYSVNAPVYMQKLFLDGTSNVYEIKCHWLDDNDPGETIYIMEALDISFSEKKVYPLFTLKKYVPDYKRKELEEKLIPRRAIQFQAEIDRNYMPYKVPGLSSVHAYQEIDPGIIFKASTMHLNIVNANSRIVNITGLSIKDFEE